MVDEVGWPRRPGTRGSRRRMAASSRAPLAANFRST